MKCLETRSRNGMKWRRYRTEEGARVETYEVPATVLRYLSAKTLASALRRARDGEQRARRNAQINTLAKSGWKSTAIASHFGISDAMARRVIQQSRK